MAFDLKGFGIENDIKMKEQTDIVLEATDNITKKYNFNTQQIKDNFDKLIYETEEEAHKLYLNYEKEYGKRLFKVFFRFIVSSEKPLFSFSNCLIVLSPIL